MRIHDKTGVRVLLVLGSVLLIRILEVLGSGAGLHVDEAQYWMWSQDLQWGYFSKPPVIAVLIRASTELFGASVLGVRLLPMLCWIGASAVLWMIGRDLGDRRAGLWAAALLVASAASGLLGLVATTDAPLTLAWVCVAACTIRACQPQGPRSLLWWMATGLCIGMAVLSKYTAGVLMLCVLAYILFEPRHDWPRLLMGGLLVGLIALLVVLPHLVWNHLNGWPTVSHTLDITVGQGALGVTPSVELVSRSLRSLGSVLEFLLAQALLLGPGALLALWLARRATTGPIAGPEPRLMRVGLVFSLPLFLVVAAQAAIGKAQINWAAPALAPLCLALSAWLLQRGLSEGKFRVTVVVGLCFSALVALGGDFRQWVGRPAQPGQSAWDIWGRMKGWHEALTQLEPVLAPWGQTPWVTTDRTTHAQLAFELKHLRPILKSWHPGSGVRYHFDWTSGLTAQQPLPETILYVDGSPPDPALRALYPQQELIGSGQSGRVSLKVWRLTR